jgi:hypothetical protein
MTKAISRGLVLIAGLLASHGVADPDFHIAENPAQSTDPRLIRLKHYFLERDCPAHVYAGDFILAADQNDLDWRLLPSISMVESTGGKATKNNNMFGWDNANHRFVSHREGIYRVAARLRHSHFYRNKDLDGILNTYNPRKEYADRVKAVMAQLGPAQLAPEGIF